MKVFDEDLVASLQELPATDPIQIEGVQFGGTCACDIISVIVTVCVGTVC